MKHIFLLVLIVSLSLGGCSKKEESPEPILKTNNSNNSTRGSGSEPGGGAGGGNGTIPTPPALTINSVPQFWGIVNGKEVHIVSNTNGYTYANSNITSFNEWWCEMGDLTTQNPAFYIAIVEDDEPANFKQSDARFLSHFTIGSHPVIDANTHTLFWIMSYFESQTQIYDTDGVIDPTSTVEIVDMAQDTDPVSGKLRVKCVLKLSAKFRYGFSEIPVANAWAVAYFVNE